MESESYKYRIIETKFKNGNIKYGIQWKAKNLIGFIFGWINGTFTFNEIEDVKEHIKGHITSDKKKVENKIISRRIIKH